MPVVVKKQTKTVLTSIRSMTICRPNMYQYVISWPPLRRISATFFWGPSIHAKTAILFALLQLKLGEGKGSTDEDLKLLPHFRWELCHEACLDRWWIDGWMRCGCSCFIYLIFFRIFAHQEITIETWKIWPDQEEKWWRECWWQFSRIKLWILNNPEQKMCVILLVVTVAGLGLHSKHGISLSDCPLFLGGLELLQKEGPFHSKQGSCGFQDVK